MSETTCQKASIRMILSSTQHRLAVRRENSAASAKVSNVPTMSDISEAPHVGMAYGLSALLFVTLAVPPGRQGKLVPRWQLYQGKHHGDSTMRRLFGCAPTNSH